MLLFLAPVVASQVPLTVDVTGMPPQLRIIRDEAAKNSWTITCEGRSGEENVLRVTASGGAASEKLSAYFDDPNHLGSSTNLYGETRPAPKSCDYEPPVSSSDRAATELAYAEPDTLGLLLPLAKDCGFQKAFIRPLKNTDVGYEKMASQERVQTLDAGEDIIQRSGPMICFLQMSSRLTPKKETSREEFVQKP